MRTDAQEQLRKAHDVSYSLMRPNRSPEPRRSILVAAVSTIPQEFATRHSAARPPARRPDGAKTRRAPRVFELSLGRPARCAPRSPASPESRPTPPPDRRLPARRPRPRPRIHFLCFCHGRQTGNTFSLLLLAFSFSSHVRVLEAVDRRCLCSNSGHTYVC